MSRQLHDFARLFKATAGRFYLTEPTKSSLDGLATALRRPARNLDPHQSVHENGGVYKAVPTRRYLTGIPRRAAFGPDWAGHPSAFLRALSTAWRNASELSVAPDTISTSVDC